MPVVHRLAQQGDVGRRVVAVKRRHVEVVHKIDEATVARGAVVFTYAGLWGSCLGVRNSLYLFGRGSYAVLSGGVSGVSDGSWGGCWRGTRAFCGSLG